MRTTGDSLAALRDRVRAFASARDWGQFHTPKNLAMAPGVCRTLVRQTPKAKPPARKRRKEPKNMSSTRLSFPALGKKG
jgi:hypothetical protein